MPFLGVGIASQVKPLVEGRVLTAAVITSVTTDLALEMLVRALQARVQPPERSIVEASSFPDLDKLAARESKAL